MKTVFEDLLDECEKGDMNYVFGASRGESERQADVFFVKYSKSCIIILTKEPLVIRITSTEVTESFKQYFDVMWKEAKE